MTNRDAKRLDGVHPKIAAAYIRMNEAMGALGFPIFVVEGVRTDARQHELWEQGRDHPGAIVTYTDATSPTGKKGTHQIQADQYGHAIDVAFVDDPTTPTVETWDLKSPWDLLGLMGQKLGLTWGGAWKKFKDYGHFELPVTGA